MRENDNKKHQHEVDNDLRLQPADISQQFILNLFYLLDLSTMLSIESTKLLYENFG